MQAVSRAERAQLLGLGVPDGKIRVLGNPLDLSEFEALPRGWLREQLGLGAAPVVLYLGRLSPRKRLDVVVRALAGLRQADAQLIIAGNDMGVAARLLRLARRCGVAPRTRLLGLLAGRQRLQALADADVVVYPGQHEAFGLVPLEALLCGAPVIVADDCGAAEVVGHTGGGLVVPPGDVQALQAAVDRVLQDRAGWAARVRQAQGRVRAAYGAPVICQGLEGIYAECLGVG